MGKKSKNLNISPKPPSPRAIAQPLPYIVPKKRKTRLFAETPVFTFFYCKRLQTKLFASLFAIANVCMPDS
jgi:hypothetical protein